MLEILQTIKESHDLAGRSFTNGVALYYAITERRLDDDEIDAVYDEMAEYIGRDILDMMEARGLHCTEPAELVELLDLSMLDNIANYLMDDDEGEE